MDQDWFRRISLPAAFGRFNSILDPTPKESTKTDWITPIRERLAVSQVYQKFMASILPSKDKDSKPKTSWGNLLMLNIITIIFQLAPQIIALVKQLEELFPQRGIGLQKRELVTDIFRLAVNSDPKIKEMMPVEDLVSLVQKIIDMAAAGMKTMEPSPVDIPAVITALPDPKAVAKPVALPSK